MNSCTYIIYGFDYNNSVGGNLALHSLAENLALLGEEVYITCNSKRENTLVKSLDPNKDIWSHLSIDNTVVVYPEIIWDNPLKAQNICRWLLNTPGTFNNFSKFEPKGTLFRFNKSFKYDNENNDIPLLNSYISKVKIFNPPHFKNVIRERTLYSLRKSTKDKLKNHPIQKDWEKIKYLDKSIFDIQIINVFGGAKYYISYDHCTYLTVIAALCGCIPIIIPTDEYSKDEYKKKFPLQKYGVAYGFDDIEYAKKTLHLVRENVYDIQKKSIESILDFNDFWYEKLFKLDTKSNSKNREDKLLNAFVKNDLRDFYHFERKDLKARNKTFLNIRIKVKILLVKLIGYEVCYFLFSKSKKMIGTLKKLIS